MRPGKLITVHETVGDNTYTSLKVVCPRDRKVAPGRQCITCTAKARECELSGLFDSASNGGRIR